MTGHPPGESQPCFIPSPDSSQGRGAWLPNAQRPLTEAGPQRHADPGLQGQQGHSPWCTEALTFSPLFFLPGCLFEDGLCRPAETCVNGKCQPTVTPRLALLCGAGSWVGSCLSLLSTCIDLGTSGTDGG